MRYLCGTGSAFLFMLRIDAYVGRGLVISEVVCIAVHTNVARDAFRAATAVSQFATSVQPNCSGLYACE